MSQINLESIKRDLRLTHDHDDALLRDLMAAAVEEALQFMNREALPVVGNSVALAPAVYPAICLLVRAKYEVAQPEDIAVITDAARALLLPYRVGIGV